MLNGNMYKNISINIKKMTQPTPILDIKVNLEQKHLDILEFLVNKEIKETIKLIKEIDEGKSTVIGKENFKEIYSRRLETYQSISVGLQTREYWLK